MRVYITGISGMLGSALYRHHKRMGDHVRGCDVRPNRFDRTDIRNREELTKHLKEFLPDRVYHCAAVLGVSNTERYPELCRNVNEFGTVSVVSACNEAGIGHIVFLSSSEVYGGLRNSDAPFDENDPLVGDNVYAKSKIYGEHHILQKFQGSRTTIARMFNCYGTNQVKQFFIPRALGLAKENQPIYIFGDLNNRRSYLYSDDAARYVQEIADHTKNSLIVNVAHPYSLTLGYVAGVIRQKVHSTSPIEVLRQSYTDREISRDAPNRLADTTLLASMTHFTPHPLDRGIGKLITGYITLRSDWEYDRREIYRV
jgi:nucleoside-diphosphate-sugar epimerase